MNYYPTSSDFQVWLDQLIWVTDNSKLTRREVYPGLAEEITGFLRSRGYVMDHSWGRGHRAFARWVYQLHCRFLSDDKERTIHVPDVLHRNLPEDYDQFHHTISSDDVMDLMEHWRHVEDFDPESPLSQEILVELSDFLYRWLDLDASKQGKKIAKLFDESESDSDGGWPKKKKPGKRQGGGKKPVDIYLVEATQGMHGGKGWKV